MPFFTAWQLSPSLRFYVGPNTIASQDTGLWLLVSFITDIFRENPKEEQKRKVEGERSGYCLGIQKSTDVALQRFEPLQEDWTMLEV